MLVVSLGAPSDKSPRQEPEAPVLAIGHLPLIPTGQGAWEDSRKTADVQWPKKNHGKGEGNLEWIRELGEWASQILVVSLQKQHVQLYPTARNFCPSSLSCCATQQLLLGIKAPQGQVTPHCVSFIPENTTHNSKRCEGFICTIYVRQL